MSEVACAHIQIKGYVQGVGFRYFAQERALALKLTGWVRNLDEDCVEIQAEGSRENLHQFIRSVSRGPTMARVVEFSVEWLPPSGRHVHFSIAPSGN